MGSAKTWLWVVLGFFGICVLSLVLMAGAGLYFVSHHFAMRNLQRRQAGQTGTTNDCEHETCLAWSISIYFVARPAAMPPSPSR